MLVVFGESLGVPIGVERDGEGEVFISMGVRVLCTGLTTCSVRGGRGDDDDIFWW